MKTFTFDGYIDSARRLVLDLRPSAPLGQYRIELVIDSPLAKDSSTPIDEEKQVLDSLKMASGPVPVSAAENGAAPNATMLALIEENRELWRRLRLLRDAMRMTDWQQLWYEYPEMKDWFDD